MPHIASRTGAAAGGVRLRWWAELPLIALVYAAYSGGRLLARGDVSVAVDNGLALLRLEQVLHLDVERALNRLLTAHPLLGIPSDFAYASLHYLLTPAVLVWLWKRHPGHYRAARAWLLASTLFGLVGFTLMPTCPPRLLEAGHGFVDTMAQYGSYGWWGGEASAPRGLGGMTNQYAAMPSLHVGWALWCAVVLWQRNRSPLVRAAAVSYPVLMTLIVMGTANHYLLDAVAGVAVMGLGRLATPPVLRWAERRRAGIVRVAVPSTVLMAGGGTPATAFVTPGCETAADERIPRQQDRGSRPDGAVTGGPGTADDGAAAAAR